ncbi:MAG: Xaa-Pro peptidase family protein [Desulfobacteraceae bacterium]|jgi:Xaa-Pro aminopeptidase
MPLSPGAPISELNQRIGTLQKRMDEKKIDGAFIIQNSDLFYFAGTIQQAVLYVPLDKEPILLVRRSMKRAQMESAISQIVPLSSPKTLYAQLIQWGYKIPKSLGMELDVLPTNLYLGYQRLFPDTKIHDISNEIRMIRAVKSDYEIEKIHAAAQLVDQVMAKVPEYLEPGITEIVLSAKIESFARSLGHQGIVRMRLFGMELFYGHIMAGPSAAEESYLASPTGGVSLTPAVAQGASLRSITAHEPILVDIAFAHDGYIADQTRIYAIGSLSEDLLFAHQSMLALQTMLKKKIKPGVSSEEIYDLARQMADDNGYGKYFMGSEKNAVSFVGHGIGVELDEYPFLAKGQKLKIAHNMVLALEPKLVFPDKGVVGIENTYRVSLNGLDPLTHFSDEICQVPP